MGGSGLDWAEEVVFIASERAQRVSRATVHATLPAVPQQVGRSCGKSSMRRRGQRRPFGRPRPPPEAGVLALAMFPRQKS